MARLIVIDGPDRGKEFELESGPEEQQWVAGRDPRLRIALADTTVSREHFRIEPMQKGFRLVDMGSRNRTFLNGEPVQKNLLRHGDLIAIGDSELRFEDEAQPTEVGEMVSTIIKEFQTEQRDSISRIINSLKNDPVLRGPRHFGFGNWRPDILVR